jgi:antitoxin HigA-1
MVMRFKHRSLNRLYEHNDRSGIRPDLAETVEEILTVLDEAAMPQALNLPGYSLHSPKVEWKKSWSVTVRANWRIVRSACLEPLGLSVTEGVKSPGVTRQTLNNIVHCKSGISSVMAIQLSKAVGSMPETWLRMQLACDLAVALKDEGKIKVRRLQVAQEFHMH